MSLVRASMAVSASLVLAMSRSTLTSWRWAPIEVHQTVSGLDQLAQKLEPLAISREVSTGDQPRDDDPFGDEIELVDVVVHEFGGRVSRP